MPRRRLENILVRESPDGSLRLEIQPRRSGSAIILRGIQKPGVKGPPPQTTEISLEALIALQNQLPEILAASEARRLATQAEAGTKTAKAARKERQRAERKRRLDEQERLSAIQVEIVKERIRLQDLSTTDLEVPSEPDQSDTSHSTRTDTTERELSDDNELRTVSEAIARTRLQESDSEMAVLQPGESASNRSTGSEAAGREPSNDNELKAVSGAIAGLRIR